MEINKKTIGLCIIASLILIIPLVMFTKDSKWYDISTGTFTAFLTAFIFSLVNYLHEKNIVINNIYKYFSEIYYSLGIIRENLKKTIENEEFYTYKFRINYDQILNINNLINMSQIDLCKFFLNSKLNKIINKMSEYRYNKLANLNNLINIQYQSIVNYEILLKDIKIKRLKFSDDTPILKELIEREAIKNENLLKFAVRLYEFEVSIMEDLNELLNEFSHNYTPLTEWEINKKVYDDMLYSED